MSRITHRERGRVARRSGRAPDDGLRAARCAFLPCHVQAPYTGHALQLMGPRSSNVRSDPTIRSLTVWETRTSEGAAIAATRAPMLTASPPIFSPILSTSPVWSPARTSIPRARTALVIAIAHRTAPAGPSNETKKAVARRVNLGPPVTGE